MGSWYDPRTWYDDAKNVYNNLYQKPADAKKAGLDQLTVGLNDLADKQKAFQLQGMNSALGMYGRANAVNKSLYGDPSSLSVAPVNTGKFQAR